MEPAPALHFSLPKTSSDMELFDADTTAFWGAEVRKGKPLECSVPSGVELRLKGACCAPGAKGSSTLSVAAEDGQTTSVLARLTVGGERDCCMLNHIIQAGDSVFTVAGRGAVHVHGNLVQVEATADDFLTDENTEGWSFIDPEEKAADAAEAVSESESDGPEEVVYDHKLDADGGGASDEDSLDDDTGTVDYSDDDDDKDPEAMDPDLAAASPTKAERREEAEAAGIPGDAEKECYNCGGVGHIARDCPKNQKKKPKAEKAEKAEKEEAEESDDDDEDDEELRRQAMDEDDDEEDEDQETTDEEDREDPLDLLNRAHTMRRRQGIQDDVDGEDDNDPLDMLNQGTHLQVTDTRKRKGATLEEQRVEEEQVQRQAVLDRANASLDAAQDELKVAKKLKDVVRKREACREAKKVIVKAAEKVEWAEKKLAENLEGEEVSEDEALVAKKQKKQKKQKKEKKEKEAVYDLTPGPEPTKNQKKRANQLLKSMTDKPSGLKVVDITKGSGPKPQRGRKIKCSYTIRLGGKHTRNPIQYSPQLDHQGC